MRRLLPALMILIIIRIYDLIRGVGVIERRGRQLATAVSGIQGLVRVVAAITAAFLTAGLPALAAAAEINIYSYRKEQLLKPQLDAFRKATGIRYNLVTGRADALTQRLRNEGRNSPADLLFTTDAGRLVQARMLGLLQPVRSQVLETAIPARYRDPEGHWFGLGLRARLIFYAVDRVRPARLSTYEALSAPEWKGRILVRSSNNIYNQSLLAALVHHNGAAKAERWARGVVANMARRPQGGDTDQLRAVAAGAGDIAIANHYYYARLMASKRARDRAVVARVKPFWPNQKGRGAHVNISGAGITKSARNLAAAIRLLEYLAGDEAQRIYAEIGHELPVKPGVAVSGIVGAMGAFKADDIALEILGRNNAAAVRMFDRAGWR